MKIIHTADWHIGNTFYGFDRSDEHRHFLSFLLGVIAEQEADALVVSGDVFDNPNPSAEAQRIYYEFLSSAVKDNPGLQIVIIAGNHDSAARLEASAPVLEGQGVYVKGMTHTDVDGDLDYADMIVPLHARGNAEDTAVCLAVPFLRPADLPEDDSFSKSMNKFFRTLIGEARHRCGKRERYVLAAHFYATGSEISAEEHSERIVVGGEENVDASGFCGDLSYVALGHIHKAQKVAGFEHARYSGSALPMSFGERGYRHGVNVVELREDGTVTLNAVEYSPLRSLLTIPSKGTATADEAMALVGELPKGDRKKGCANWPYVEVRLSGGADSTAIHSLKQSFDGRAALLCVIRDQSSVAPDGKEIEARTEEELRQLDPLLMMRRIYAERNGGAELPPQLADKFNTAARMAEERIDED